MRFQGGHNAGHTLVIDGVTVYKLSTAALPALSGPGKLSIIGNGVVHRPLGDDCEEIEPACAPQGLDITPKSQSARRL